MRNLEHSRIHIILPPIAIGCLCGAGRCPTNITYDVSFDGEGRLWALRIDGVLSAGAVVDLAADDGMLLKQGAGQVRPDVLVRSVVDISRPSCDWTSNLVPQNNLRQAIESWYDCSKCARTALHISSVLPLTVFIITASPGFNLPQFSNRHLPALIISVLSDAGV